MTYDRLGADNWNGMRMHQSDARAEALCSPQITEPEPPPCLRLSTHGLRQRDRFEVFRENFRQYLFQVDVANRAEGSFDGNIELLQAGSVGVSRITAPPSVYARTRRHV